MLVYKSLFALGTVLAFASQTVTSCQPPNPVYQRDSRSNVRSIDVPSAGPPAPPLPLSQIPFLAGNEINDDASSDLRMGSLSNEVERPGGIIDQAHLAPHKGYLSYPGYIPPSLDFPTLQPNVGPLDPSPHVNDIGNSAASSPAFDHGGKKYFLPLPLKFQELIVKL
ncbi:unnamed protein product [Strongylus vulgaris]|uniref:Uncharacterized protein n=1 Tax=Strongylus vulgaris TaxID=40348 RepID=A0A3P7K762_STRVU|nr:unnamed protein product [Strongylus vulgaris]